MKPDDGLVVGQFVSARGIKGIISEIVGPEAVVRYHNGRKMSTIIKPLFRLKVITEQELIDYCKERGDTSFVW